MGGNGVIGYGVNRDNRKCTNRSNRVNGVDEVDEVIGNGG